MKKILLMVLIFVSLAGFKNHELETSGAIVSSMPLDLLLPPKVTGVNPSYEILVEEGNMITFGINYESKPSANVIIRKGTELLKPSSTCSIAMTGDEVIIYLKNVKEEDEGMYSITLDNDIGSTMVRFTIKVKKRTI